MRTLTIDLAVAAYSLAAATYLLRLAMPRWRWTGLAGHGALGAGVVVSVAGLGFERGLSGTSPWVATAAAACVAFLAHARARRSAVGGAMVAPLAVLLLDPAFAKVAPATARGRWVLPADALVCSVGVDLLTLAGFAALLALVVARFERRASRDAVIPMPSARDCFVLHDRLLRLGFASATFGLLAGATLSGAASAQGGPWPAVRVTAVGIWIAYAVLLHARVALGWTGLRAAVLTWAVYGASLAAFTGLGLSRGGP